LTCSGGCCRDIRRGTQPWFEDRFDDLCSPQVQSAA
jgi:hypothetical protein